jgi:type I restriction-modification system DNA methylase subunit
MNYAIGRVAGRVIQRFSHRRRKSVCAGGFCLGARYYDIYREPELMDNRTQLESLSKHFSVDGLVDFLRKASGKFKPERDDYRHFLDGGNLVRSLHKLGKIEFENGQRLIVLAGALDGELTSQSGKLRQFEVAKKVLKAEYWDAGIFVFYDDKGHFRFSLITANYSGSKREFSNFRRYTYFVSPETSARTFVEQIGKADFSSVENITAAFSVEPVTKEFFRQFREIFEEAEATIKLKWSEEKKRLYTQRFFNRVLFITFLERKGWLTFRGRKDYLKALFADYYENTRDRNANFHRSRLNTLFFMGLNHPSGDKRQKAEYKPILSLIGDVPYLNGGLFEEEEDDKDGPTFPDGIIAKVLNELVYQFNFTVTESTPLDVEVAVDPEMLGRIFEELVTGRHESGSYYTPKPVVAFMCREALKGYLATALPSESADGLALFVDKNDAKLVRNPMQVVDALRAVKVCDPACGSGAYLLGMLHELLEQYAAIFSQHQKDGQTIYQTKLDIIQNNLYGVDKDNFAVNIARLRLWLSLIVDFEGGTPPPLPNLDFKIECGDSLTAPDPSGGLQPDMFRQQQVKEFLALKNAYMDVHEGSEKKKKLGKQIDELKKQIEAWAHPKGYDKESDSFDWQVDFAEVFAPELAESTLGGKMAGLVNATKGQMEMTAAPKEGGFDIILANPPYVRQELLGDYKDLLKPIYPEVHNGTADLYVYFYARAHQLLKNSGVSCFISSNKWLRAGYGEKLRQHLLDSQAFKLVVDFGELPVFQTAATFPAIFLWQKQPRNSTPTQWAVVKNLQDCYNEGILEHVTRIAHKLPATQFGKDKPRLVSSDSASQRTRMEKSGQKLGELKDFRIYFGIKTGLNKAFIIDRTTRDKLLDEDRKNETIIKPLLVGDDLRHYGINYREKYLIFTRRGIDISKYPTIERHLRKLKQELTPKKSSTDKSGRKPGTYEWYEIQDSIDFYELFDSPKIIYPDIGMEPRFSIDLEKYYIEATGFLLPTSDWYLLGVLNSKPAFEYLKGTCSVLGDEEKGGRIRFKSIYMETLPIPDAPQKERDAVAKLAKQAQSLHTQRRKRVEKFLREIDLEPAESTSRNPLESPWSLGEEDFVRRAGRDGLKAYKSAQEETLSLTEEAVRVESAIDERVKALYGV